jgi:hypothetical protein
MGTHTHRGFVPLVAIVLIGLAIAAGGAVVAVSVHKPETVPQATDSTADLAPVSPRVASSTESAPVEPIKAAVRLVTPDLKPETEVFCSKVMAEPVPNKPSLLETHQTICVQLKEPAEDTPEQRERWQWLEEKAAKAIEMQSTIDAAEASAEQRQKDIENGTR